MTDDELLKLPKQPDYPSGPRVAEKVRSYERDLRAAIEECLSKYVAESCYDDAKRSLEGAIDAFGGLASLTDDLDVALTAMDDFALLQYGQAFDALERCAPDWREEIALDHVKDLA